jgi:hypothetical protein
MKCPHCGIAFHDAWTSVEIGYVDKTLPTEGWWAKMTVCPACKKAIIDLEQSIVYSSGQFVQTDPQQRLRVYPANTFRKPTPNEVPPGIKEDYEEACKVLPVSNKASAALSRRCLQAVLQAQGYTQRDLAVQIDALLNEQDVTKAVPSSLRQTVDVIRHFGNFAAHRITDQTTLQVLEVEPGEAEWCLDILEEMFDQYYVKPAEATARKAALDAKLRAAGRHLSK